MDRRRRHLQRALGVPASETPGHTQRDGYCGGHIAPLRRALGPPLARHRALRGLGGFETDIFFGHAWRYRDYVIRSFNADKPFNRFIQEQIAGDELFPGDVVEPGIPEKLAAGHTFANVTPNRRRAALAEWIASDNNLLTARVIANRTWQWHFGEGLVRTPKGQPTGSSRETRLKPPGRTSQHYDLGNAGYGG